MGLFARYGQSTGFVEHTVLSNSLLVADSVPFTVGMLGGDGEWTRIGCDVSEGMLPKEYE